MDGSYVYTVIVEALVVDLVATPDLEVPAELLPEIFINPIVWHPIQMLNEIQCINTNGIWKYRVTWVDTSNIVGSGENYLLTLTDLHISDACADGRPKKVCELVLYA